MNEEKPLEALSLAELDASLASMVAELPGKFRWEKLHRHRNGFGPSWRAATATETSYEEVAAMIDEVAAEVAWQNRQRLLAQGVAVSDGASEADVNQGLRNLRSTTLGSERWLRQLLIETLLTIWKGCKSDLDESKEAERDRLRDPDKYVHLCVPLRHRRLYRLVEEWNTSMPWIGKLLNPKDEVTAVFIMAGLKSIGIDAYVTVGLSDLHEERRIG